MSMPKVPEENNIYREDAVNLILASIGMEELGLSHILNAEGEKLQYVLGTTDGTAGLAEPPTVEDILDVNKSVRQTLSNATRLQMMLGAKMESAMSASTMEGPMGPQGPQGPTGPVGVILASYTSLENLKADHPTGNQGDAYLVGGDLYIWDTDTKEWRKVGTLSGPPGPQGPMGPVGIITGSVDSPEQLPDRGKQGDTYLVNGVLFVWDEEEGAWEVRGSLRGPAGPMGPRGLDGPEGPQGPKGEQGIQGIAGTVGTIKGSFESEDDLPETGEPGDFYYIYPDLWVWDEEQNKWSNVGQIAGPQGLPGIQGERGDPGPTGPTGPVGTILGSFDTLEELEDEYPTGNQGEAYLVGGDLYVWNATSGSWERVGNLRGPTGPEGPTGPPGPAGKMCAIIPFSSGEAEFITSSTSGGKSGVVSIGFGQKYQIALQLNEYIDLPAITGAGQRQLAFSMPSSGVISSMSAFFSVTTAAITANNVFAELYYTTSMPPSNRFQPVPGAKIQFNVPANVPVGTIYEDNIEKINFPVPARTRLLMVFYNTTPIGLSSSLTGFMSGGLKIEDQ